MCHLLCNFFEYKNLFSVLIRCDFATNLLYHKCDNLTDMAITGHQTEMQFLRYIKITPREKAEKLKDFWDKQTVEK